MNSPIRVFTRGGTCLALLFGYMLYILPCDAQNSVDITTSDEHPNYWSYKGKEILLLGGSKDDNLFQWPDVTGHLDTLKTVGGNYVRCTMSSSNPGNVKAFLKNERGLYDLERPNPEYWHRFASFLKACYERDIIVQVEIWATFNFYRDHWETNPFNPKNNINYDARRTKLSESVDSHPIYSENNFFRSVPSQLANSMLLRYQQAFVDHLLSISLQFGNVLYCIDNETSVTSDWAKFWAKYIQKMGKRMGKKVYTTEMWDPWNLDHPFHAECIDHPEVFNFIEISQNNHQTGDEHWDKGLGHLQKMKIQGTVRPVNNIKVYGNDKGVHQSSRDGIEDFIRNVFMGCASTRFHRQLGGLGLTHSAQMVIGSMSQLVSRTDFFKQVPHNDLLIDRKANGPYCRAVPGKEYLIYFTKMDQVQIMLDGEYTMKWLDVLGHKWSEPKKAGPGNFTVVTPKNGHFIALIQRI